MRLFQITELAFPASHTLKESLPIILSGCHRHHPLMLLTQPPVVSLRRKCSKHSVLNSDLTRNLGSQLSTFSVFHVLQWSNIKGGT